MITGNDDAYGDALADAAADAPWLVADIGGTNVRFALLSPSTREPLDAPLHLRCADFSGPEEAAREFLRRAGGPRPRLAAFAVATPLNADLIKLTNSHWAFTHIGVKTSLNLDGLVLINDFEALALSLPALRADQYRVFAGPAPALPARAAMAVIGPGTGLGVAGVIPTLNGWFAVPGEGGHVTLAPADDRESEVLRAARAEFPHVSAERLLSGIGLPTLYRALATVRGESGAARREIPPTEEITARAAAGTDPCAIETMEMFCALLGSFSGNVALTLGARAGVFIGGGIVPRLGELFTGSRFRERFEAKGRFQPYLQAIPTPLLTAADAALAGAGQAIVGYLKSMRKHHHA